MDSRSSHICSHCNIPFTNSIETYFFVNVCDRKYDVHQHGENIVVRQIHSNKIICKYKVIDIHGRPRFMHYPLFLNRGLKLKEEEYIIMCAKIFVSENLLKYVNLRNIFYFPRELICIIVYFWNNLYN